MHVIFSRAVPKELFFAKEQKLKKDFTSTAPAPFVGHVGYPHLNVGILSLPQIDEQAWEYDAPRFWAAHNKNIPQVIDYRTSLINSRFKSHVKDTEKMVSLAQEVGMAAKPAEVEIHLKDKPTFGMETDRILSPMGPRATIQRIALTSNPSVNVHVEKAVSDTDL